MDRTSFDDGWQVRPKVISFVESFGSGSAWQSVRLPHDAMIAGRRDPAAGPAGAYFPGGAWEYRKRFDVPEDLRGKRVVLELEGVYRSAAVFVNGDHAGHRPYGYSNFEIRLDQLLRFGERNEIRVDATAHEDSRWYSGAGIYRPTWLLVGGPVHLLPEGVHVRTPAIDDEAAVVEVATEVRNDAMVPASASVVTELVDPEGRVVARDVAPLTVRSGEVQVSRQRLVVPAPARWCVERPHLHTCRTELLVDGEVVDREGTTFGIRSLEVDAARGMRINGEPVKLRGACIHHDNGVLGAATFARAEERRVELLRAAGFNALRSAHHPMSRALLDACDRLGMLVMDEAFDMWSQPKSNSDYARSFPDWWEADVEAMVRKDRNHPSVVMYSIGNEIPEAGSPAGAAQGRAMAQAIRALDDSRFTTNAVNPVASIGMPLFEGTAHLYGEEHEDAGVNTLLTGHWAILQTVLQQDVVDERTAESFGAVDVAGYNYLDSRYEVDHELHPNRVIVGAETFPVQIADGWAQVQALPHLIGDFTWTGWDYLGEVGVGRTEYEGSDHAFHAEYPWLTAWVGDLDITGHRRPLSYYREIVFGLRQDPYVVVRRPEHHGRPITYTSPWAWSDAVSSWSWPGFEGQPVTVEVYADADEVELLLDDRSLARLPGGAAVRFKAEVELTYEPGTLAAVAYRGGIEVGRSSLRSASGPVLLGVRPDRASIRSDGTDLTFVDVELVDAEGTVHTGADRAVHVDVAGPGVLQGLGSGNPCTEETFEGPSHDTFDGRVLAVVRPTGPGTIVVTVTADRCQPVMVEITTT
jgi:beta-galactosidase